MLSMVPLVETLRSIATGYPSPYPRNIYGESFHTAMGDELTTLVMAAQSRDYVTVHTEVGEAGQAITVLQKGAHDTGSTGRAYAASLFEVAAIARLAKAQGKSYGVGAIVLTHGESDAASATFEADMVKLWQSYNQDLPGLTGQTAGTPIPMLLSQQHSEPTGAGTTSTGTLAQWRIGLDHPGDIICTGPKYQYAYVSDNIHVTNAEYERLGEKYGEVMSPPRRARRSLAAAAAHHRRAQRRPRDHRALPRPVAAAGVGHDAADAAPVGVHGVGAGARLRGPQRDDAHRDQQRRDRGRHRPDHNCRRPARGRCRCRLRVDGRRHDPPERDRALGPAPRHRPLRRFADAGRAGELLCRLRDEPPLNAYARQAAPTRA